MCLVGAKIFAEEASLNIYGQTAGTGELIARGSSYPAPDSVGIGSCLNGAGGSVPTSRTARPARKWGREARSEEVRARREEMWECGSMGMRKWGNEKVRKCCISAFSHFLIFALSYSHILTLHSASLTDGFISLEKDGLQFNGSNWIETDYCPAAGDRFECDVMVDAVQSNASAAVFGTVRESEPERTFAFYVRQGGDDSSVVTYGDMASGGFFPRGKEVSLSVGPDGATWTWDGGSDRLSLMPGFARDGVMPLLIGDANAARREDGILPAGTGATMKLHRFRIWRGGLELVHDYVPCSNAVSGILGVFDLCETAGKNPFRGLNMLSDIPYRASGQKIPTMVEFVCSNAFLVLPDTTVLKDNCWYFVRDAVSCGSITVEGSAHLILGAGAKLTARAISGGTLAVYGQPQGVGELTVAGTVSSGLTVEGGFLSAGTVSGDALAVVGGTMKADSVNAGGVTIDGGSVMAPGETVMATNSAGHKIYCVTVVWKEGSEEGKGLRLEGLSGYGTNDIYAIDNRVYLWLPNGTYDFTLSNGETTYRYHAVVDGANITVEPLPQMVPVMPGELVVRDTAEEATNVAKNAVLTLRDDVSAMFGGDEEAKAEYCAKFGFAVVPTSGGQWAVVAGLKPEAWSNLVETAQAATRQIPVADIAALPLYTPTNVTAKGCGVPGFYYSFYSGSTVTNLGALADEKGRNVLCGTDGDVEFSGVVKPSDTAGFFTIGVGETPGVQPSDRAELEPPATMGSQSEW